MKKTKTLVSKRTKTPPKKAEILEEELPKTPTPRKKNVKASRKTPQKKPEILEEEIPKTPKASRKTPTKKVEISEEEIPKTSRKTPEISEEESPKTSKKTPKASPPPEPIQENNKIGIDNINVLFDSLLKISVKDILSSFENPDMTTPFNNILAIS